MPYHRDVTENESKPADAPLSTAIYAQLKAIARAKMAGEGGAHTLQATALVHEAWLRLRQEVGGENERSRFLVLAARTMHRVLIDHARGRKRQKRRPEQGERVPLSAVELSSEASSEEILAVEEALCRLHQQDARMGDVARLRIFADLDEAETAATLEVSARTVRRDWALARAWLQKELAHDEEH